MAALVRERGGSVVLSDVMMREPGEDEILVRIHASGVCPTDLFGMSGGAGDRFPAVFGHEGAGIVEATGPAVTKVQIGDRVVLSFDACGACTSCDNGHPAYCERFAERNHLPRSDAETAHESITTGWMAQSSWSTLALARETNAVRIPDDVPWEVAAPLGCGILTGAGSVINVLRPGPADSLLVLGAGTTGLAGVMAAHHRGALRIIVSDPDPARRALALELGATEAWAPGELDARRLGVTHALDTVGRQDTIDAGLAALRPRGVCATVALHSGSNRVTVSQSQLLWGRTLTGVVEGDAQIDRDIAMLIGLWRAGHLPVEKLIRSYRFDEIGVAIDDARAGRAIKPVLMMDADDVSLPTTMPPTGALIDLLRDGRVPAADLPTLWRSLPAVRPEELRGLWQGIGLSPQHRTHRMLTRSGWFGKLFRSDDDVVPLVCEGFDGVLTADVALARGGAMLRTVEHEGIRTAAMVYDGMPIIDLFTRLGPDAVLGVMTGRHAADDDGALYYFALEKVGPREVIVPDHLPRST
ncbi:alcohol dehydrogenase catalytic domain-containing protein [Microbacterium sp. A84]|uniref:alcohol dehydrogenase catalytic domain-containing protein n=1 Tax=Microbacterium sp. A84 TaxID=3450715 RepID=UPI003F433FAB